MKLIMHLVCTVLILGSCQAQKDIPSNTLTSFNEKYPTAQKAKWEKEDDKYEVEFEIEGKEMSASYSMNGEWVETETEMDQMKIPEAVKVDITSRYMGFDIEEAEMIESPAFKGFEISLKNNNGTKIEVIYTLTGDFVKDRDDDEEDEAEEDK